MKQLVRYLILILFTLSALESKGQQSTKPIDTLKPVRIMYLVDVSSSMMYDWQSQETRMKVVGRLINDLTDSLIYYNPDIDFGLRLIGSEYPAQRKVCTDTKLEVPFGTYNSVSLIKHRANTLKPYGFTPIAYALEQTATYDFANSQKYNYSIILITDGGESCNGDICAIMQQMLSKKISFKPYILSLVKDKILEDQYACLGNYINVLEQKDFNVAINKIISENKTKLNITKDVTPLVQPKPVVIAPKPKVDTPVIKQVTLNPVKPVDTPRTITIVPKIDTPKTIAVTPKPQPKVDTPKLVVNVPKVDSPKAIVPELKEEQRIKVQKNYKRYTVIIAERSKPKRVPMPLTAIDPFTFPVLEEKPIVKVEPKVEPKPEPKPISKPEVTPTPKPNPITSKPSNTKNIIDIPAPPKELDITVITEPAEKTQLRVKFVTRSGKEIFTEPMMKITNIKTKAVKNERRTVTAGSKAITPVTLDAGKYNIMIGNSSDYTKDIELIPNQMNTVTIQVNPSSLQFQYENNKDRPVKEYVALVSDPFSRTRTNTKQPCDTKMYYDPASYHVEVNTLPPTMYFLDLDFGVIKMITIPENGTLHVTNTNRVGRIELFYQLGDAYKFFYKMDIMGQVDQQKLDMLPGHYQIRYYAPGTTEPKTKLYKVDALKVTTVEL